MGSVSYKSTLLLERAFQAFQHPVKCISQFLHLVERAVQGQPPVERFRPDLSNQTAEMLYRAQRLFCYPIGAQRPQHSKSPHSDE